MLSNRLPLFNDSIHVSDKRVIVRVDFNVPAEQNKITDDYRILRTLPLLEQLRSRGARIMLLSHLTEKKEHRSFEPLMENFQQVCGFSIKFAPTPLAARQSKAPVTLLENLRAFPGEENKDPQFAKELALVGDLFINEAFSQSHRSNTSIVELPKLLPSYAGPLFYEEIRKLGEASSPEKPFLLILGGVKFATKIGVLEHFMEVADSIFIGGALANTFLVASGFSVGESPVEQDAVPHVRNAFIGKPNVMLPSDVRVEGNEVRSVSDIRTGDVIYDLGPVSSAALAEKLQEMRMILWNGPLGFVERGYNQATSELIDLLAHSKARVIIGGGDTLALIRKQGLEDSFYYLSTGGGAMLEFLAKGTLPGIDALLETRNSM